MKGQNWSFHLREKMMPWTFLSPLKRALCNTKPFVYIISSNPHHNPMKYKHSSSFSIMDEENGAPRGQVTYLFNITQH